jgi:hydroxypyruvate reductase
MTLPGAGNTLDDLKRATITLLRSGATIVEINTVRRHASAVKGGRLGRASGNAQVALVLSDVIGDAANAVGSGPTAGDATTCAEARTLCTRFGLTLNLTETPTSTGVPHHIVASPTDALQAAAAAATRAGLVVQSRLGVEGEARVLAGALVDQLRPGHAVLWSGEPTVTVRGTGRGGRAQEFALAAALALRDNPGVVLAAGTDGTDGPTDAAGGLVDGASVERMIAAGYAPLRCLENNDSYPALRAAGDLLVTGPTLTNALDLMIGLS